MGKIIIEPYLLALQENSVVIAWEVNQNSNYSLKYKKIGAKTYKNARKYLIHEITKEIVTENDLIITENLQIKRLIEKKEMSKYISDASLSEIIRQLEYKSKCQNKHFYQINTYYPSSQICSHCNTRNKKIKNLIFADRYIVPRGLNRILAFNNEQP